MPVARELGRLADTLGRRGGIGEARIQGATAALGLRKAEYDIGRQQKADALALPGLELARDKAERQKENITFGLSDVFGKSPSAYFHAMTPWKETGETLLGKVDEATPGKYFDPKTGQRKNADGSPTEIPRWEWEQKVMPGLMNTIMAHTDLKRKLDDTIFEMGEELRNLPEGSEAAIPLQQRINQANDMLKDKTKMAAAYSQQSALLTDALRKATSLNMNPNYIKTLQTGKARVEKKLAKLTDALNPQEKAKYDLEIEKLRAGIDVSKVKLQKEKNLAAKAKLNLGKDQTGKVPDAVKQAKSIVLRYNTKIAHDPMMQKMIAAGIISPESIAAIDDMSTVPEDMQGVYREALKIINDYYGVQPEELPEPDQTPDWRLYK